MFLRSDYLAVIAAFWKEPTVAYMFAVVESYLATLKDRREEGQGMVEYALIIALVAVVVALALGPLASRITALFNSITF